MLLQFNKKTATSDTASYIQIIERLHIFTNTDHYSFNLTCYSLTVPRALVQAAWEVRHIFGLQVVLRTHIRLHSFKMVLVQWTMI